MAHPLVDQLRFTRSEWLRALRGMSDEDGARRFGPITPVGWIVAHLAWQEQRYWLTQGQGITVSPEIERVGASGGPPSAPTLSEMLAAWRSITAASDPWLDSLDARALHRVLREADPPLTVGNNLRRTTYHYWFHAGEIMAVRQLLDHPRRAQFVGDLDGKAPYISEADAGYG
jgi:hypothetical protein